MQKASTNTTHGTFRKEAPTDSSADAVQETRVLKNPLTNFRAATFGGSYGL